MDHLSEPPITFVQPSIPHVDTGGGLALYGHRQALVIGQNAVCDAAAVVGSDAVKGPVDTDMSEVEPSPHNCGIVTVPPAADDDTPQTVQWEPFTCPIDPKVMAASCNLWDKGHKLFVFGGFNDEYAHDSADRFYEDLWELSIDTGVWRRIGPGGTSPDDASSSLLEEESSEGEFAHSDSLTSPTVPRAWPTGRHSHSAFCVDGLLWILGGHDIDHLEDSLCDVWSYDPETEVFTKHQDCPVELCGTCAEVMDGEVHLVGSYEEPTLHMVFSPSKGFRRLPPTPFGCCYAATFRVQRTMVVIGGVGHGNMVHALDTVTGLWSEWATIPFDFFHGRACLLTPDTMVLHAQTGSLIGTLDPMVYSPLALQYRPPAAPAGLRPSSLLPSQHVRQGGQADREGGRVSPMRGDVLLT
ncbi:hypothetical protein KIPB_004132 [Kipferlia bialata]|uniref:Uncharacterized protein n=1 Tax=Kipferlia bialata TaxID=797122 RepID=A0A9K3CTD7_9EUKA|nr:hypothetical protein KIPB_004132 [Kipferlia bialata]|eukprot:g4132.t1